jgi:hypothetical protein
MTNRPPDHVIDAVEEGFRLRGRISNGYAQIEYLLGDIIMKAYDMPEYNHLKARLPNQTGRLIDIVNKILVIKGFFSQYKDDINFIIGGLEFSKQVRDLLAHGYCSIIHDKKGVIVFQFRKWHRDENGNDTEIIRDFQMIDLEYQKAQIVRVSSRALDLSHSIHKALGLVGK